MMEGSGRWSMVGLHDGLMLHWEWRDCQTDRCWFRSEECGPSSILFSLFILFQPFFVKVFRSGTVPKRLLHVNSKSHSTSFVLIEIPTTKLYGSPQTLLSYGPACSCLIYIFENTWYILASGKFSLIPSFLIIFETRSRKKACCYPLGDKKTTYTAIFPWF